VYAAAIFSAIAWAAVKLPELVARPESIPRQGICDDSDADYTLGCIEFRDDGTLRQPAQLDEVLARIKEIGRDHSVAVVAFMHGWNNDCDDCNPYLNCLRVTLKAMGKLTARYNRKVVGVYLAWRGMPYRPRLLNEAVSFWGRDEVAGTIGDRGYLLNVLYQLSQAKERVGKGSVLIATGHSLGAKAMFRAYRDEMEQVLAADVTRRDMQKKFTDLVVLLNPAFSAAEYDLINQASGMQYRDNLDVPPNSLIVSSESDYVTSAVYPLSFRTWWMPWAGGYSPDLITTVGNFEPYRTHRLVISEGKLARPRGNPGECDCPEVSEAELMQVLQAQKDLCEFRKIGYRRDGVSPHHSLWLVNEPHRKGPYYVVQVSREILDGHSQIYSPAFVDFLLRVVNARFYCPAR
jgi:hypothetical protein